MKGNEISSKQLHADAAGWLAKLHQTMLIKDYGKGSVRNYTQQMCLLSASVGIRFFFRESNSTHS